METHLSRRPEAMRYYANRSSRWKCFWQNDSICNRPKSESVSVRSGGRRIRLSGVLPPGGCAADPHWGRPLGIPRRRGLWRLCQGRTRRQSSVRDQSKRLRPGQSARGYRGQRPAHSHLPRGRHNRNQRVNDPRAVPHHCRPDRSRRRHLHQEDRKQRRRLRPVGDT